MPTSSFVESGFWCFDALFVPQQHPAREMQDTFYLSDPVKSLPPPRDYYERVSRVHEHGGYGSIGYRAPWSDAESHKLLLRTHTTASSAKMLYKLAARCRGEVPKDGEEYDVGRTSGRVERKGGLEGDGFHPAKLFSIDRVFRNETMDATHLAEFHQVEGVVADRGLTLADLIGRCACWYAVPCAHEGHMQALCVYSSGKWALRTSDSNLRTIHTQRWASTSLLGRACAVRTSDPINVNDLPAAVA
jgi:phenylalanyl-tRNA synthetase alpha chain